MANKTRIAALAASHYVDGRMKRLADCTVDEIGPWILDSIAGFVEDDAAQLRNAVGDPEIGDGAIEDLVNKIDGEIWELVEIYAYRETLRAQATTTTPLFDSLKANIGQVAAIRAEARQQGWELPEEIRELILAMRAQLRDAGMSDEQIDGTEGLELPDGIDE